MSNAAYVDWLYVADYLLICCGTTRDDIDEANHERRTLHRNLQASHDLRVLVEKAITIVENDPSIDDKEIVKQLKSADDNASLVTVKEAKRWIKLGARPTPSIEPVEPKPIGFYERLYA